MKIRDLQYLVALADHQHFGKAADACFVSQPALSMQIKKLETILDIQLLERTNKSVLLTDGGAIIATRARQILQQVAEVHEIAKTVKDPCSGELRLGIFPTLAPYLLPLIIPNLRTRFPNVSLYLVEEPSQTLIAKLNQAELHAIFLALPVDHPQLHIETLFTEEYLLAAPKDHPLSKQRYIQQQDLENRDLLLLTDTHCMREQALSLCQSMRAQEAQHFRATSLETLRHMVSAGVGITLMPKLATYNCLNLSYVEFAEPKPTRTIGLAWRKISVKKKLLMEITEEIRLTLEKQD